MARRPPPDEADLATVRTALEAGCQVDAICPACDHVGRLDLAVLKAGGRGNLALIHLALTCSACGGTAGRVVVSGRAYRC